MPRNKISTYRKKNYMKLTYKQCPPKEAHKSVNKYLYNVDQNDKGTAAGTRKTNLPKSAQNVQQQKSRWAPSACSKTAQLYTLETGWQQLNLVKLIIQRSE